MRSRRGSGSSIDDDDDDETFQILTAESLFSTLLSRVRSTYRLIDLFEIEIVINLTGRK